MSRGSISPPPAAPNPRNPSHPTQATTQVTLYTKSYLSPHSPPLSLHLAHVHVRISPGTTGPHLLLSFRSPTLGIQVAQTHHSPWDLLEVGNFSGNSSPWFAWNVVVCELCCVLPNISPNYRVPQVQNISIAGAFDFPSRCSSNNIVSKPAWWQGWILRESYQLLLLCHSRDEGPQLWSAERSSIKQQQEHEISFMVSLVFYCVCYAWMEDMDRGGIIKAQMQRVDDQAKTTCRCQFLRRAGVGVNQLIGFIPCLGLFAVLLPWLMY